MAGLISKTKVIGEIGPIATGDAKLYVDGFKAGALAADPKATVHVSYTGSFSDPSLMSKQATEYLAEKVDVLTGSSQSVVGAITVCQGEQGRLVRDAVDAGVACAAGGRLVPGLQLEGHPDPDPERHQGRQARRASYAITLKNGGEKIAFNPGYTLSAVGQGTAAQGDRRASRTARSRSRGEPAVIDDRI